MKKIFSLILTLTLVVTLCACANTDTSSDVSDIIGGNQSISDSENGNGNFDSSDSYISEDDDSSSKTDKTESNTSSGAHTSSSTDKTSSSKNPTGTNNSSSSNKTDNKTNNKTDNKTDTNKPNNDTATHTHSFAAATCTEAKKCSCGATDGKALGHKWEDATCKAPKTCSVCKKSEGNKAEHVVNGTTCKWCKQVVAVSPTKLNANITYSHISDRYESGSGLEPDNTPWYVLTYLRLSGHSDTQAVYNEMDSPCEYYSPYHNGKYYLNIAQASGINGETSYRITESEIVVTAKVNYFEELTIHFQLLSDNTIKVVSLKGATLAQDSGIKIGSIFYPSDNS